MAIVGELFAVDSEAGESAPHRSFEECAGQEANLLSSAGPSCSLGNPDSLIGIPFLFGATCNQCNTSDEHDNGHKLDVSYSKIAPSILSWSTEVDSLIATLDGPQMQRLLEPVADRALAASKLVWIMYNLRYNLPLLLHYDSIAVGRSAQIAEALVTPRLPIMWNDQVAEDQKGEVLPDHSSASIRSRGNGAFALPLGSEVIVAAEGTVPTGIRSHRSQCLYSQQKGEVHLRANLVWSNRSYSGCGGHLAGL